MKRGVNMKLRTFIYTLIIGLLILIIALLFEANDRLNKLDEVNYKLNMIQNENLKLLDKVTYQGRLIEELSAKQHKPEPAVQPKVNEIEEKVIVPDTNTVIRTIPFIPAMVEKLKGVFSY
jgi:hypothetical protein